VKFADVDLDEDGNSAGPSNSHGSDAAAEEDEEAIEEDEEEGMVDLLDILDGKAQPYFASDSDDDAEIEHEESALAASRRKSKDDGEDISPHFEDDSEQDEESGSDAEDNDGDALMESAPEEDEQEAADEALANLSQFVSGLDTTSKRKVADTEELKDAPPRKRRIKEMTEAGPESEFSARAASGMCSPECC
jgi:U3 small nucleolar RNA-associated protein 14